MAVATRKWKIYRNVMFLLRSRRNPVRAVQEIQRSAGDYVCGRFEGSNVYLISDPEAIGHVLHSNQQNYISGEPPWSPLVRTLGNGLLFADGERYRRQRQLVQPAFQAQRITSYSSIVRELVDSMLQEWRQRAGTVIDMHQEMVRLTMVAIAKALFDIDLSKEALTLAKLMTDVLEMVAKMSLSPLARLPWLPSPANRRFTRLSREFDKIIYAMIEERRASGIERSDLLSLLLRSQADEASSEDPHKHLSDREVRDHVTTLLGAGHETVANMLTWTWYLLARYPEVEARLHAELDDILGGRNPRFEDLRRLPYTEKVMCETLRLYPPTWINKRRAAEPDSIRGYAIPAGASVFMSPYVVQRDPRWFSDPELFAPERFGVDAISARPEFSYFPFGGGSRKCIGQSFAEMEGRLVLATLAQHFTPRLVTHRPVKPKPIFLRPPDGLPMQLVPRANFGK